MLRSAIGRRAVLQQDQAVPARCDRYDKLAASHLAFIQLTSRAYFSESARASAPMRPGGFGGQA